MEYWTETELRKLFLGIKSRENSNLIRKKKVNVLYSKKSYCKNF